MTGLAIGNGHNQSKHPPDPPPIGRFGLDMAIAKDRLGEIRIGLLFSLNCQPSAILGPNCENKHKTPKIRPTDLDPLVAM
jgi:hypothetical protein